MWHLCRARLVCDVLKDLIPGATRDKDTTRWRPSPLGWRPLLLGVNSQKQKIWQSTVELREPGWAGLSYAERWVANKLGVFTAANFRVSISKTKTRALRAHSERVRPTSQQDELWIFQLFRSTPTSCDCCSCLTLIWPITISTTYIYNIIASYSNPSGTAVGSPPKPQPKCWQSWAQVLLASKAILRVWECLKTWTLSVCILITWEIHAHSPHGRSRPSSLASEPIAGTRGCHTYGLNPERLLEKTWTSATQCALTGLWFMGTISSSSNNGNTTPTLTGKSQCCMRDKIVVSHSYRHQMLGKPNWILNHQLSLVWHVCRAALCIRRKLCLFVVCPAFKLLTFTCVLKHYCKTHTFHTDASPDVPSNQPSPPNLRQYFSALAPGSPIPLFTDKHIRDRQPPPQDLFNLWMSCGVLWGSDLLVVGLLRGL